MVAFQIFHPAIDILLLFMATTPIIDRISKGFSKSVLSIYSTIGFMLSGYFLYGLYREVNAKSVLIIGHQLPWGGSFEIDALGIFMASIYIMLGFFASIFSYKYMEKDTGLTEYYALLLGMVAGMIGTAFAGDFLTFFLFWELMSLTSYVLVAFRKDIPVAIEASLKYLIMSAVGTITLIYGISILYGISGNLNFAYISSIVRNQPKNDWLYISIIMIATGLGVKAAIVPMHTWLPDAHPEAPSSISAMLSGALITIGVYGLIRIFPLIFNPAIYDWSALIAILSAATMTLGNIAALMQKDLKRLLAYSSIAHIGYALIGVAIVNQAGFAAALLHLFNHAVMKGLAFLCAGSLIYRTGTRDLSELSGIGKRMPITSGTLSIALFALMGFPPLNGFVSKYLLFTSALNGGMFWLAILGIVNSIISCGYYLRVFKFLILDSPSIKLSEVKESHALILIPLIALTLLTIITGVYPINLIRFAEEAAESALKIQSYIYAALKHF
jgi:proton-translocating NADH-quinone oxidoreductase chain N